MNWNDCMNSGLVGCGFVFLAAGPGICADAATFSGNASWYGGKFHGRKTASGEIFDMKKHTAAHRKLPFFTKVLVENPRNGKSVVVKVNDRGPYAKGRVLDLSRGAAEKLGILLGGVAFVDCTVLPKGDANTTGSLLENRNLSDTFTAVVCS